jgi:hypothetical protein
MYLLTGEEVAGRSAEPEPHHLRPKKYQTEDYLHVRLMRISSNLGPTRRHYTREGDTSQHDLAALLARGQGVARPMESEPGATSTPPSGRGPLRGA